MFHMVTGPSVVFTSSCVPDSSQYPNSSCIPTCRNQEMLSLANLNYITQFHFHAVQVISANEELTTKLQ